MEALEHADGNALFDELSKILKECEEVRSGLDEGVKKAIDISHVSHMKEPSFHESIRVLFWAISSNHKGVFADSGIEVTHEPPFFNFPDRGLYVETAELKECVEKYFKTIIDGPELIIKGIERLEKLVGDSETTIQSIKDEGGLTALKDGAKAAKNLLKVKDQIAKVKKLKDVIGNTVSEVQVLMPKLIDYTKNADEIGKKAYEHNLVYPYMIFDKFHEGPMKTQAEIDAMGKK